MKIGQTLLHFTGLSYLYRFYAMTEKRCRKVCYRMTESIIGAKNPTGRAPLAPHSVDWTTLLNLSKIRLEGLKMAKNSPSRNEHGNYLLNQDRKCLVCGVPFNCGSIGKKVYCSTRCRMADYRKKLKLFKGIDND